MLNDVYVLSFVGVEFIIRRLVVVVIVAAIAIVLGKYGRRHLNFSFSSAKTLKKFHPIQSN